MILAQNPRHLTVLRLVRRHGPVTRAQIGLRAKLSASQVSRLVNDLIDDGYIETERAPARGRNRPADRLMLARAPYGTIGLDIGGVTQQAVVANLRGEATVSIHETLNLATFDGDLIDHLVGLVERVLKKSDVDRERILGLGFAFRAIVDPVTGSISRGPESPHWSSSWTNLRVRELLAERLLWERIAVDDTVRVLGLAEARYGLGSHDPDFVYVLADSGIGAALMLNGKPYIGPSRISGEIGHITIDPSGPECACGRRGCIDTYASAPAMLERANREQPGIAATITDLDRLAKNGDDFAANILAAGGTALGVGLAALLNILGPKLIVVSGDLAGSDAYLRAATESAKAGSIEQAAKELRLLPSRLGPLAGAAGSAAMILDQLFEAR